MLVRYLRAWLYSRNPLEHGRSRATHCTPTGPAYTCLRPSLRRTCNVAVHHPMFATLDTA